MMTEVMQPAELPIALPYLLAGTGPALADRTAVDAFLSYTRKANLRIDGFQVRAYGRRTALALALFIPGGSAMLMVPEPGFHGIDPESQARLTADVFNRLSSNGLRFVQALLEPDAPGRHALLRRCGMTELTTLLYLERDANFPWTEPPDPRDAQWVAYNQENHGRFVDAVVDTYVGSLDCPELSTMRSAEDALAGHRAAGPFDPAHWELPIVDGAAAGCLLMTQLADARLMEVVYMGVAPRFRGRGVGKLLLRRALQHCHALRARQLAIVVDERNAPARALYDRFHFKSVGERRAYLRQS